MIELKTEQLHIKTTKSLKKKLKKRADEVSGGNISQYITKLILDEYIVSELIKTGVNPLSRFDD